MDKGNCFSITPDHRNQRTPLVSIPGLESNQMPATLTNPFLPKGETNPLSILVN